MATGWPLRNCSALAVARCIVVSNATTSSINRAAGRARHPDVQQRPTPAAPVESAAAIPMDADEARYKELFADTHVGIYFLRPGLNGAILSCNRAFAEMVGFSSV